MKSSYWERLLSVGKTLSQADMLLLTIDLVDDTINFSLFAGSNRFL